jgi:hypothetical protein
VFDPPKSDPSFSDSFSRLVSLKKMSTK